MRAYADVFRSRPGGAFVLRPYRRARGPFGALGMPVVLIPKEEYAARIVPEVLASLEAFEAFAEDHEFDRSPELPLQSFGALIESDGEQLTLSTMKRRGGGHVGTGERLVVKLSEAPKALPARLLQAMGERPEDVDRFIKRYGSVR